jgi:1-acyl-sn-glycerol-3-phosphate acyltransferase
VAIPNSANPNSLAINTPKVKEKNFYYIFGASIMRPLLNLIAKKVWIGIENIPKSDGAIIVANHTSYLDGLFLAHMLYDFGRPPRFLVKSALFHTPIIGRIFRGADQIEVIRNSERAHLAIDAAVSKLAQGKIVGIFPEGTLTLDPNHWPQAGKTGAARLAATTGVPIIPVAIWGGHKIIPTYKKAFYPIPRKKIYVVCGPKISLENQSFDPENKAQMEKLTEIIMKEITILLEKLRAELVE